jgi:putative transposase
MARQTRLVLPGLPHLISLRALAALDAFPSAADRERFVALLREAAADAQVKLHALALLPQEVRALVTPGEATALSRCVQAVGRRYVSAYNRSYGRAGTLWAGRFRCAPVEPGAWAMLALRYVDAASAEPGLTSASQRTGGAHDWALADPPEYWMLGNTPFERERAYAELLSEPLSAAVTARFQHCLAGGWICGGAPFVREAQSHSARRAAPRARGRPAGGSR